MSAATNDAPLRARSLEELHLFLDLAGLGAERSHALVEEDGRLVAVYAGRLVDGQEALPAAERAAATTRLRRAIAHLDEVLLFVPSGAERVPDTAFWTPAGRDAHARRSGAFDVAMLQAERRAWTRLLREAGEAAAPVALTSDTPDPASPGEEGAGVQ